MTGLVVTLACVLAFQFQRSDRSLARLIAQDIFASAGPLVGVRFIENTLVLEGTVGALKEKEMAIGIARAYLTGLRMKNFSHTPELLDLVRVGPVPPGSPGPMNSSPTSLADLEE